MKHQTTEVLVYGVNAISIGLFFYLSTVLDAPGHPLAIRYLAWLVLGLGFVLLVLSTATLIARREAGLIEGGIYGVVRHPMYLGAALMFLSWTLFVPHWIVLLISCSNVAVVYWFMLLGERRNIAKFGDPYARYMRTVPRLNLLAGLIGFLHRK